MATNLLEMPKVRSISWPINEAPCVFTIGYEGLTIDRFIERLLANQIRILIDVRNNPQSRKRGFSKSALRVHLEEAGISYQHIPELGVPSVRRKNLKTKASYKSLFSYYERKILASNLDSIERIKVITIQFSRVALMCFEADYHSCHRCKITEYLSQESSFAANIVHLS